ncbi:hypothetical protein Fmac_008038 [Flemingia macrophylla]|uniref:Pentatricopeptide repeat-containing protein n=1 Tax=Flemingia macrophylla TaxID=520843 RepID=A0ABD1MXG5_9FABA
MVRGYRVWVQNLKISHKRLLDLGSKCEDQSRKAIESRFKTFSYDSERLQCRYSPTAMRISRSRAVDVCFSALVVTLAHNFLSHQALSSFSDMRGRDFSSIVHRVSGGLRAAAHLAVLDALIDTYSKGSVVDDARRVFKDNFSHMNVVGWNAMMVAYA